MRGDFIRGHADAISQAIAEGIPVRGYFHWSLMDNFEWTEGFAPRFGLFRVDYKTLERRPAGGPARGLPRPRPLTRADTNEGPDLPEHAR
jgi:beta-glucosidase